MLGQKYVDDLRIWRNRKMKIAVEANLATDSDTHFNT